MDLEETLRIHFGYSTFREGQKQVIRTLLDGHSALAIFPTGGGKSLCYQLPAILLEGLTLVVSPLIALMKDQVDMLRARNIAAARIDSTLSADELHTVYDTMQKGALRLLYIAPERLLKESFIEQLRRVPIALLAIDESHCISEWGHNFRPEYLRLEMIARKLKIPRVLALTATATPEVVRDIRRSFRIAIKDCIQTPYHRKNLHLHITPATAEQRLELLTNKLRQPHRFPAIVYVTLQATAESVAAHLKKNGILAAAYHAGFADAVRTRIQEEFMQDHLQVIVATIAFGMGIDKSNIRSVFHFNLPKTPENYQQEIGRAGRDGQGAHCEILACGDDLTILQNFTLADTPTATSIRQLVDHLLRQGQTFDISRYELSRATDIRPLVLETILIYLEHRKILEPLGSFYETYQIAFNHSEEQILSGHTAARKQFLHTLFHSGKRGSRWLTLNIGEAAQHLDTNRNRILKALHWLEESGDIALKPSGLRYRFRKLQCAENESPGEITLWLTQLFQERERQNLERLEKVVELMEKAPCITQWILRYFGEKTTVSCGHCGRCIGVSLKKITLPRTPVSEFSEDTLFRIQSLIAEQHAALRNARTLTRFLCGISSPAILRDRLTRHDAFGLLEDLPFATVLAQIESMILH